MNAIASTSSVATEIATQPKTRFFVIIGRESCQVFEAGPDVLETVSGFDTREDAEDWIELTLKSSGGPPTRPQTPSQDSDQELYSASHPRLLSPGREPPLPPLAPNNQTIPPGPTVILSPEQQIVLDTVVAGGNVFFTGPAGTGKSVLLREIIRTLGVMRPNGEGTLAVTAPTGIAAINIGGTTIHSFAGIGLGKEEDERLAKRIQGSKLLSDRWKKVKTLIIDEISMLDGRIFDKLVRPKASLSDFTWLTLAGMQEYIARFVRDCPAPFGGIQLVISGDFCQLPPVPDESHKHRLPSTFCFDAKSWSSCINRPPVLLTQVFRQNEREFVDILAGMRTGNLTPGQIAKLQSLSRPLIYSDGIEPTELYPTRAEVDACNQKRLDDLSGVGHVFLAIDRAGCDVHGNIIPPDQVKRLLDKLCIAPPKITLKEGSQVMLIKNIVQGSMVNGSTGKVIGFMTIAEALTKQIAISVRKDKEEPEIPGGRRRPDMIDLSKLNFEAKKQKFPLVQFTSGGLLLCAPTNFTIEGYIGNVECERMQVPLIMAWAISVHKSQGQTLARAKVDLRRIFEKGQAYVAISRATSMEHLEILNFNVVKVQAHPRVLEWQRTWLHNPPPITPANPDTDMAPPGLDIPTSEELDWDEMDSMDAIEQYHSNFISPSTPDWRKALGTYRGA